MKAKFLSSLVLILGVAAVAAADVTKYDPPEKMIPGTLPFQYDHTLKITSPSLNPKWVKEGKPAMTVEVTVDVADFPTGGSRDEALGFIALESSYADCLADDEKCYLTYENENEYKYVTMKVKVPINATPGDYAYTISVDSPTQFGWGHGEATFTLSVTAPSPQDNEPPIVTINSPEKDKSFTFCLDGTPISINFEAIDSQSTIKAMAAAVNHASVSLAPPEGTVVVMDKTATATVSYSADTVGSYIVDASATDAADKQGHAESRPFTVNYTPSWLPPLSLNKVSKGGSTVPIKFAVRDCNGQFVYDESVRVTVEELPVSNPPAAPVFESLFGTGSGQVRINDTEGQYLVNFQTAPGVHTYRASVYFSGSDSNWYLQASKDFSVR